MGVDKEYCHLTQTDKLLGGLWVLLTIRQAVQTHLGERYVAMSAVRIMANKFQHILSPNLRSCGLNCTEYYNDYH
jgi:hypothetical protein